MVLPVRRGAVEPVAGGGGGAPRAGGGDGDAGTLAPVDAADDEHARSTRVADADGDDRAAVLRAPELDRRWSGDAGPPRRGGEGADPPPRPRRKTAGPSPP